MLQLMMMYLVVIAGQSEPRDRFHMVASRADACSASKATPGTEVFKVTVMAEQLRVKDANGRFTNQAGAEHTTVEKMADPCEGVKALDK